MKTLILLFSLFSFGLHAAIGTLGGRFETETVDIVEVKVDKSYETWKAEGKNPKFLMLTLDLQTTSYTTAEYSSGTDYTPAVGRVFHVRGFTAQTTTLVDWNFIMCTSTAAISGAGSCTNAVYYSHDASGSGFPQTLHCDNTDSCTINVYNFSFGNGRYIALNSQSGGTRGAQVFGYEVDE